VSIVKLGLIQTHADDDASSNLARTLTLIDQAAAKGANIIVLQELFMGPYFCQEEDQSEFDRAEAVPGPTSDILAAKSKELGVVICASLFEKRASGLYHNTSCVLDADGAFLGKYRKMHVPEDPASTRNFTSRPATLASKFSIPNSESLEHSSAGTNGTQKRPEPVH
jgi:N-carbamoylputrescine amidase